MNQPATQTVPISQIDNYSIYSYKQGAIPADSSREQMQLRLTGLVVPRDGQLRFYNPIYAAVFTPDWVRSQLQELRPTIYAQAINDWEKALPAESFKPSTF